MQPTLYILMRDDMVSLNPGKAMAQASHATNEFEQELNYDDVSVEHVDDWRGDLTFGRCLTVAVNGSQLEQFEELVQTSSYLGGVILDPTYPISDGEVTHTLPVKTCGWTFLYEDEYASHNSERLVSFVKKLSLYK